MNTPTSNGHWENAIKQTFVDVKQAINEDTANIIISMIEQIGNIPTKKILQKVYPSLHCIVSDYDAFIDQEVAEELQNDGILYTSEDSLNQAIDLYTLQQTETYTTEYIGDWVLIFRS